MYPFFLNCYGFRVSKNELFEELKRVIVVLNGVLEVAEKGMFIVLWIRIGELQPLREVIGRVVKVNDRERVFECIQERFLLIS